MISLICGNLKYPDEPIYKTETHQHKEQTCGCQQGGGEEVVWMGVGRCKLSHLEWESNEVLLYSTGNYIQALGIDHKGR